MNNDDDDMAGWHHQSELEEQEMKTDEMITSKFLKQTDVGKGVLATVQSIKKTNVSKEGAEAEYKYAMYFNELDRPLVLNVVNIRLCEKIFNSFDTDDWTGKSLVLYADPTIMFGNEMKGGIRVRAPKTGTKPPPPPVEDFDDDIPF